MKKVVIGLIAVMMVMGTLGITNAQAQEPGRGGPMGFIAGCCFGIRAAMDYNEGKEIHWREWCRLIPYVGGVFAIWDGVEGYQGKTRAYYVGQYGAMYY